MKTNTPVQESILRGIAKIEDAFAKNLIDQESIQAADKVVSDFTKITNAIKAAVKDSKYEDAFNLSNTLKETLDNQVKAGELKPEINKTSPVMIRMLKVSISSASLDKDKPIREFSSGTFNPESGVYKGKIGLKQTQETHTPLSTTTTPLPRTNQYGPVPGLTDDEARNALPKQTKPPLPSKAGVPKEFAKQTNAPRTSNIKIGQHRDGNVSLENQMNALAAVMTGDEKKLREILSDSSKGFDINAKLHGKSGNTLLHYAKDDVTAELLISEYKANPRAKNDSGLTYSDTMKHRENLISSEKQTNDHLKKSEGNQAKEKPEKKTWLAKMKERLSKGKESTGKPSGKAH